jgi:hypothetical protein
MLTSEREKSISWKHEFFARRAVFHCRPLALGECSCCRDSWRLTCGPMTTPGTRPGADEYFEIDEASGVKS